LQVLQVLQDRTRTSQLAVGFAYFQQIFDRAEQDRGIAQ
jgi:hypothetical protein